MVGTTRYDTAVGAAKVGGATALEYFRATQSSEQKSDGSLVTEADRLTQTRISSVIRSEYPHETIVGEEGGSASTVPDKGTAWVVDPIDGTGNFVRGAPQWSVSIAALVDGETIVAVNHLPAIGDTYTATHQGVFLNGGSVGSRSDTQTSRTTAALFNRNPARPEIVVELLATFDRFRRIGYSQSVLSQVATGAIDVAVTTASSIPPWDVVGGVFMVEQAGGTVTDIHGDEWTMGSEGLVASTGGHHEKVVKMLRQYSNND